MRAKAIKLLSSGEFCKLRYDTIPVKSAASFANCVMTLYLLKVHLQKFPSILITQKCQISSCDRILLGVRYTGPQSRSGRNNDLQISRFSAV